jgi:nucleoside-diphosphate-sugar epimerase
MKPRHGVAGVEYAHVDIRDKDKLGDTFRRVRPDIVYHLAAQHDPSLAETAVTHTLTTNITGTNNVIEAARASDTSQIVYASTGKALRPFTPDTYASSKKASEWLMADAVKRGEMFCSGVRFTHVVDNSIIHRRIQDWIANDQPIRLHGSDILFYMQSAKESAHLLLNVGLEAEEGTFNLQTIRDLDWPVNLMDLALGAVARAGTNTPVYICGFESGYEERAYPGLYDPMLSGEMSPLINAFEAPQANHSATCPQVDNFPFEMTTDARLVERLRALERVCAEGAPNEVLHEAKDNLSWTMLDTRLRSVSKTVLERIARRMANVSYREQLTDEHRRINSTVNAALRQG